MSEELPAADINLGASSKLVVPDLGKPQTTRIHWLLPSITDVFFLVVIGILAFSSQSALLLRDSDIGWHIRTGEFILSSHSVPRIDLFSYTRAGQPWFAWEWLFDALIAAIHHAAGLNGVVLFSALILGVTYALLFRFIFRHSGSFVVSLLLTLLAFATAQVHMLARPHIFSWLFTLLWVEALFRFENGKKSALLLLPPLMVIWVNVHGGFILGLVLLALFGCSHVWKYLLSPGAANRQRVAHLAMALAACIAVTFVNPYGYKLHLHVYQYLSTSFFLNSIYEFRSPNFHVDGYGYFELTILLSVVAVALARSRATVTELLLLLFAIHAGLYALRNIPISAILIALALGSLWSRANPSDAGRRSIPPFLRSIADAVRAVSENMGALEKQFRGHGLAIAVVVASAAISMNGGRVGAVQFFSAHFDETTLPVRATEFIAAKGIHDHLFSPDLWSGYLIYRLYPATKLYFDDRHDFYGQAFIEEYLKAIDGTFQWRQPLDRYQVRWVLISANSPLSTLLKESKEWHVEYDDGLATVFSRIQ